MKASPLQKHPVVNCRCEDELLPLLTVVCSNNWSSLSLKVCASFMSWRFKASATSQWFLLNLPLLKDRAFWNTAVSFYGDSSALDSRHCPFLQSNSTVLCSLSQQRIFSVLSVASCFSLFPPNFFIVSWRNVGISAKCHILVSVSPVLNVQVLSLSHFYLLCFCSFIQRFW